MTVLCYFIVTGLCSWGRDCSLVYVTLCYNATSNSMFPFSHLRCWLSQMIKGNLFTFLVAGDGKSNISLFFR